MDSDRIDKGICIHHLQTLLQIIEIIVPRVPSHDVSLKLEALSQHHEWLGSMRGFWQAEQPLWSNCNRLGLFA